MLKLQTRGPPITIEKRTGVIRRLGGMGGHYLYRLTPPTAISLSLSPVWWRCDSLEFVSVALIYLLLSPIKWYWMTILKFCVFFWSITMFYCDHCDHMFASSNEFQHTHYHWVAGGGKQHFSFQFVTGVCKWGSAQFSRFTQWNRHEDGGRGGWDKSLCCPNSLSLVLLGITCDHFVCPLPVHPFGQG